MARKVQEAVIGHAQADLANVPGASGSYGHIEKPASSAPSTSSVLWAAWRQGLKDLQAAVLGGLGGTHDELGTIANPVQMEVYKDRHNELPQQEIDSYQQSVEQAASLHNPNKDRSRTL